MRARNFRTGRVQQLFLLLQVLWISPWAQGAEPYNPAAGPFQIGVSELSLSDSLRQKELSVKIRYPQAEESFPVIIFSHGYTYDERAFGPLSEFWATKGYVTIHPTHIDAKALTQLSGKSVRMADPEVWRDRVGDLVFLIDSLEDIQQRLPDFTGSLDKGRLGVGGHSFGAYTSMLLGGATVLLPGQTDPVAFGDLRVKAILPIAGQGRGQQGLHDHSWDNLALPMMMISGTEDRGLKKEKPSWRAEGFQFSPAGDKYWAFVTGAEHFSYSGKTSKGVQNRISEVVKISSLAFWDAYLRSDASAQKYLRTRQLGIDFPEAVEFFSK